MSTAQSGATTLRDQRVARLVDREVVPIWHDRFSRMVFRDLKLRPETFALDIGCGSGQGTAELLTRLDERSRVFALEADPALVTLAKARVRPEWKNRVYFKPGNFDDVTGMAADTYDLTIANLVLGEEVHDWRAALVELIRVTKPGGQILATLPLHGTWMEVEDLFEEVLRDYQLRESIRMLQHVRRTRPRPRAVADAVMEAGIEPEDFVVEHELFQLLFRSGREFLFAPVIEHGPLRVWKAMLGKAKEPQKLFWRFKETIDTYYAGRVLSVSVLAGVVRIRLPGGDMPAIATEYWQRFPQLDAIFDGKRISATADEDEDFDLDIDMDMDMDVDVEDDEILEANDPDPEPEEDDDIDTDAIFAALAADEEDSTEDFDDLDAAFGDTFDMTQEMDASDVKAAIDATQQEADDEAEELALLDALEEPDPPAPPKTNPKPAPKKATPKPPPARAKGKPKPGAPKASASGSNPKIPPPPPTGVHPKVKLPPLPKPKKKR